VATTSSSRVATVVVATSSKPATADSRVATVASRATERLARGKCIFRDHMCIMKLIEHPVVVLLNATLPCGFVVSSLFLDLFAPLSKSSRSLVFVHLLLCFASFASVSVPCSVPAPVRLVPSVPRLLHPGPHLDLVCSSVVRPVPLRLGSIARSLPFALTSRHMFMYCTSMTGSVIQNTISLFVVFSQS
jgi:hypothetical protein